jgi:5-oxoprolinase (ATP-hydrolysing)
MNLLTIAATDSNDAKVVNLGGKNTVSVKKHDRLSILSPGGGGYGARDDSCESITITQNTMHSGVKASGSLHAYEMSQESA